MKKTFRLEKYNSYFYCLPFSTSHLRTFTFIWCCFLNHLSVVIDIYWSWTIRTSNRFFCRTIGSYFYQLNTNNFPQNIHIFIIYLPKLSNRPSCPIQVRMNDHPHSIRIMWMPVEIYRVDTFLSIFLVLISSFFPECLYQ